jgi:hypothetical protein
MALLSGGQFPGARQISQDQDNPFRLVIFQSRVQKIDASCPGQRQYEGNALLARYRLIVFSLSSKGTSEASTIASCLGPKWQKVPFRQIRGGIQIPTGEIFVKFKSNTTRELICDALDSNQLQVIEEPKYPGEAYRVSQTPSSSIESLKVIGLLRQLRYVEYAEPNWVTIHSKSP